MVLNRFAFVLISALLASAVGCQLRGRGGGGGNTNDNAAANGLTDAQRAAVDDAVSDLEALATTLAGAGVVSDPPEDDGTFGECPEVTGAVNDQVIAIRLDYGDGCTDGAYGEAILSGSITGTVERGTRSVSLTYEDFTIDGQSVNGSITFGRTADLSDGDSFETVILLEVSGAGTIDGTLTVNYDAATSIITIIEGDLTLAEENGDTVELTAEGLVYDPVGNGNFISGSGTLTLTVPNDDPPPATLTIEVTFDEESPQDGTVDLRVGDAPTVEYELEDEP